MRDYRWGIVGTGSVCATFCDALTEFAENASIKAVCSRSEEKGGVFAARYGCGKVYTDIYGMCESDEIDIVYIGTPHTVHIDAILAAAQGGKHILCEKPMTINARQAELAFEIAKKNGVFIMEAMWTRFLPAVVKTAEWIEDGEIGEVTRVIAKFNAENAEDPSSRLFDPMLGGGALLDLGVYPILAANMFLKGEPFIVSQSMIPAQTGVDKDMTAVLKYDNGDAVITCSFDSTLSYAVIEGTKGYITVPDWCYAHSAYLFKKGELAESFCQPRHNGKEFEAVHVMECIEKGLTQSPLYPYEMTLRELKLCDSLRSEWGLTYKGENEVKAPSRRAEHEMVNVGEDKWNYAIDWYRDAAFYHIYPLGMCGAPTENDFTAPPVNRLSVISETVGHIATCGFNTVYFGPLFESSRHGYDTADFRIIDRRLGTNGDFARLCSELRSRGIRVVLDGVFNHVGRDFWAFRDLREKKGYSPYKDWFNINWSSDSNYSDGFGYEGWEGHYDLVKLNLRNPEVRNHIFDSIRGWVEEFGIDGLRLDVAYCLDHEFLRELHRVCKDIKQDFFLLGEVVHGEYKTWVNESMLDSVTNYECYKGIYSSINSANMHEIGYSLHRQFGAENWCLYKGLSLYNFVDNHDVSRIASVITDRELLQVTYALMYAMPGIPSVYYGSEVGVTGIKEDGDHALRLRLNAEDITSMKGGLTDFIARLNGARCQSKALRRGDYKQLYVQSKQLIFARSYEEERVIVAINTDGQPHTAHFDAGAGRAYDLITGQTVDFGGGLEIPAKAAIIGRVY